MFHILFLLLIVPGIYAQENTFRTTWNCPSAQRGDLPERREVEVKYNGDGEIVFRPNIFALNPIGFLRRLVGRGRSGAALGQCVNGFFDTLAAPLAVHRRLYCSENSAGPLCRRSDDEIRRDVARKIKSTSFYRRHQNDLVSASAVLSTDEVAVPGPETPVEKTAPADVPPIAPEVTEIGENPAPDDSVARARALDFLLENYGTFQETRFREFQQTCPDLGATAGVNREYCEYYYRNYRRVISNATQLLSPLKGHALEEGDVAAALACLPPRAEEFRDISEILGGLQRPCGELAVGEFRRFPNASTPSHNYFVRRTDENTFEATVVVDFRQVSGSMTGAQMIERSNNCFQALAPYLKTPDGRNLRIRNISPEEADRQLSSFQRPPPMQITVEEGTVGNQELRGHSRRYTDSFRCETIVHETLHHLGLCDEYREKDDRTPVAGGIGGRDGNGIVIPSMADAWSCRFVPAQNTIMQIHSDAIRDTVPLAFNCRCREDNQSCRRTLSSGSPGAETVRRIMTQPPALIVFGHKVVEKCSPLDYAETVGLRNRPVTQRLSTLGENPDDFILIEAMLVSGPGEMFPTPTFKRCRCQGNAECLSGVRRGIEHVRGTAPVSLASCPWEMMAAGTDDPTFQYQNGAGIAERGETTRFEGDGLRYVTTPRISSQALIAPGHLSRIVYGGCETGPAANYNRCSSFAQRAIASENTEYCAAYPEKCCTSRPSDCTSDRTFLGLGSEQ